MAERRLLYVTAFLRAIATGLLGVLLGVYLARQQISGAAIGSIVSAGLAGATLAAIVATFFGDRIGRRRFLIVVTLLSMAGTVAFAMSGSPLVLGVAAFVGMLNGMGKDRGAALILEQAALPGTAAAGDRPRTIAWYTMLQDLGHATGSALAGLPVAIQKATGLEGLGPHRAVLLACAAIGVVALGLYARLGSTIDRPARDGSLALTARSRRIL